MNETEKVKQPTIFWRVMGMRAQFTPPPRDKQDRADVACNFKQREPVMPFYQPQEGKTT